jgi:hypothetical protein
MPTVADLEMKVSRSALNMMRFSPSDLDDAQMAVYDVCKMLLPTHTSYGINTMRYKGRDSASEMGRKMSIIRPGATTVVAA